MLTYLSKILEKLALGQLMSHVNDLKILPLDCGEVTCLALLDYSRAFELANYQFLLTKLKSLAEEDSSLEWFGCYLENRRQYAFLFRILLGPICIEFP